MFNLLKIVSLVTIGFMASDLGLWKGLAVGMATILLAFMSFAEGFYEGYNKATNEILKAASKITDV